MARRKRLVIPGAPHHITQRGGRRQDVFFEPEDYSYYLELLKFYAKRYGVEVLAYCLMTNHVHHLLVPLEVDSLSWTLQMVHKRYADYINAQKKWAGHLWQQRFYSAPVDDDYFWVALKYIERNPVEAGMVSEAVQYKWSSAAAHSGLKEDAILSTDPDWLEKIGELQKWEDWLDKVDSPSVLAKLRKCTARDLPCGSDKYLDALEIRYGNRVRALRRGRPRKEGNA